MKAGREYRIMLCMRTIRFDLLLWITVLVASAHGQKPQIMILGTTHFDNPNHDISNMAVDDVLTPARQQQIEKLVEAVARFKPTRIAIELPPSEQSHLDQRYAAYRSGKYALTSNERDQLGLRLAAKMGISQLDAVDYKSGPPGPDGAYDFAAYAATHGLQSRFEAFLVEGKQFAAGESNYLHTHTMLEWFQHANAQEYRLSNNRIYFEMLRFGDNKINPGANWVGGWHARNMIILENVRRLAKPEDRVLVIFGAGHTFLLDQLAKESGDFDVVNTEKFLAP